MVAQTYNPSYLGGKDWEDCSLRPAWAKQVSETLSQQVSQVWWSIFAIQAEKKDHDLRTAW
jgi:hypothetical protein